MCDSGQSPKKRRYFLETEDFPPMYAGDTKEQVHACIEVWLEALEELTGEDELSIVLSVDNMTDEEVAALPDI